VTYGETKAKIAGFLARAFCAPHIVTLGGRGYNGSFLAPRWLNRNPSEQLPGRFFDALHRYWGYNRSAAPGHENMVRTSPQTLRLRRHGHTGGEHSALAINALRLDPAQRTV